MMTLTAQEWVGINTAGCKNGPVRLILSFEVKGINCLDLQEPPIVHKQQTKLTALFGKVLSSRRFHLSSQSVKKTQNVHI